MYDMVTGVDSASVHHNPIDGDTRIVVELMQPVSAMDFRKDKQSAIRTGSRSQSPTTSIDTQPNVRPDQCCHAKVNLASQLAFSIKYWRSRASESSVLQLVVAVGTTT